MEVEINLVDLQKERDDLTNLCGTLKNEIPQIQKMFESKQQELTRATVRLIEVGGIMKLNKSGEGK